MQRINMSSGSDFEAAVGYSRAVRIGPHVAVAGTTGSGGDIAAQMREALRRMELALGEAGAKLTDVVRTRIYVTDITKWRQVARCTLRRSVTRGRRRRWWRSRR